MTARYRNRFRPAVDKGIRKGISGYLWILKILIPVSFFTFLLDTGGWLYRIDFLLAPVMGVLSLPAAAALPLIIGLLTGIYGSVAAMSVLSLTPEQMTLIAIFLLISHGLIQEGIVQARSGIHPAKATLFRLGASIITVMAVAPMIGATPEPVAAAGAASDGVAFLPALQAWALDTLRLCVKIFGIILALMISLELMKAFRLIDVLIRWLTPFLRIMGLDRQVAMLWLTAGLFGITYGAAVIVEETRDRELDRESLTRLHLSIGINHAMIEDPALFLPLGILPFWLWVPRLVTAILAVHLLGLWYRFRHIRAARQAGETPVRAKG